MADSANSSSTEKSKHCNALNSTSPGSSKDIKHHHKQDSHVRFPSSQVTDEHELGIVVENHGDNNLKVHLGFLKLYHHYNIEFVINDDLGEDAIADPLQNLHCRIIEAILTEDGKGHKLVIDFHAHKDKLDNETLVLSSADNSKRVTIVLMARVLGKHKGTPMLKNGIKCVGQDPEDESEQSDWQGF